MDFYGAYGIVLEKSGRLRLPGDIGESFGEVAYLCEWPGPCVKIYTEEQWNKYIEDLKNLGNRRTGKDEWEVRTVFRSKEKVEVQGQGRITVPQKLRDHAKLRGGDKILMIGAMDHLELWASDDVYDAAYQKSTWQG
jgi:MraZ protein